MRCQKTPSPGTRSSPLSACTGSPVPPARPRTSTTRPCTRETGRSRPGYRPAWPSSLRTSPSAATPSRPTTSCTGATSRPAATSPRSKRPACLSRTSATSSHPCRSRGRRKRRFHGPVPARPQAMRAGVDIRPSDSRIRCADGHGSAGAPAGPPRRGAAGAADSGFCRSAFPAIQALQQVVRGKLDFLVPPLGRPVLTGDDAYAVQTAEVAEDERVPGLGVILGTVGEAEMPSGVFLPRVRLEEGVLVAGAGLYLAPVAVEHVLAAVDEVLRPRHAVWVHRVRSHRTFLPRHHARNPVARTAIWWHAPQSGGPAGFQSDRAAGRPTPTRRSRSAGASAASISAAVSAKDTGYPVWAATAPNPAAPRPIPAS